MKQNVFGGSNTILKPIEVYLVYQNALIVHCFMKALFQFQSVCRPMHNLWANKRIFVLNFITNTEIRFGQKVIWLQLYFHVVYLFSSLVF
jgi:hypothetical protein